MPTLPAVLLLAVLGPRDGDPLPPPDPQVTRAALEHHVRFLASDELRGRALATPESLRASEYLARALERAGVEPGVPRGTEPAGWFQEVPLNVTEFHGLPELRLHLAGGEVRALEFGREFTVEVHGDPQSVEGLAVAPVREPGDVPAEASASTALVVDFSRARGLGLLEEVGHAGGAGFGLVLRARADREGRPTSVPRRSIERAWESGEDAPEVVTVMGAAAALLWEGEVESVDLVLPGERTLFAERNVVGVVRGTGPAGPAGRETVVLTAHFDHVGVEPGADLSDGQDHVRNGADDDASGTAALLELAEAFAAGEKPARDVVFLFCAAEEVGMWGTQYWVDHPTVPLARVVANLNLEMLGMPDALAGGPGALWLTGYDRTDLGPSLEAHGVHVVPDPRPEQRFFVRSDNVVFVKAGVVGQTLSTGGDNPNYHRVSDEPDTLDFDHMRTCTELSLRAARLLADGVLTPAWNEGQPDLSR